MTGPVMLHDPKVRRQIEAHVQYLIDMLDQVDGDADFEDAGDAEPDSDSEEGGDREPSLGRLESIYQGSATLGATDDLECDASETGIGDDDGLAEQLGGWGIGRYVSSI